MHGTTSLKKNVCYTLTEVFLNVTEVFFTLTEAFPCFFLSCKANARVKLTKTGHGPRSSISICICVVRLLFVLFYVLFVCKCVLPPGDNPTAVNKCVISYQTQLCLALSSFLSAQKIHLIITCSYVWNKYPPNI